LTSVCDSAPPDDYIIAPMQPTDLDEVLAIERAAFPSAWSRGSYERELRNSGSYYFTVRYETTLVGYAGMWVIIDEAHITTLAVHQDWRRRGIAAKLLTMLIAHAREQGASRLTLEVRVHNEPARALYRQFGFEEKGLLHGYYGDTGEDGIVMWKMLESTPA
jgi:[ribosomal protein S18]-alanine N-acetyltransferase